MKTNKALLIIIATLFITLLFTFLFVGLFGPELLRNSENSNTIPGEKIIKVYKIPSYKLAVEIYAIENDAIEKIQKDSCWPGRYASVIIKDAPPKFGLLKIHQIIDETLQEVGYKYTITELRFRKLKSE